MISGLAPLIPVHYLTTRRKLNIARKVTVADDRGVRLWSGRIGERDLEGTYGEQTLFYDLIVKMSGLPGARVQACFAAAAGLWASYRTNHASWVRKVAIARAENDRNWLRKLLEREPKPPFTSRQESRVAGQENRSDTEVQVHEG